MKFLRRFLLAHELRKLEAKERRLSEREQAFEDELAARTKFKLVHTHTVDAWWRNGEYGTKHEFKITYYFFESKHGERFVEMKSTLRDDTDLTNDQMIKKYGHFENWTTEIVPWIKGQLNPKIPSYAQAETNDVTAVLAGKRLV